MKVKGKEQKISKSGEYALRAESSQCRDGVALSPVYRLATRLFEADSEGELYDLLVEVLSSEFESCSVSVMVLNEQSGMLEVVAARGMSDTQVRRARVRAEERVSGWVHTHDKPLLLHGKTALPRGFKGTHPDSSISSAISFPMSNREGGTGVITISRFDDEPVFGEDEVALVSLASQLTVMAVENMRLNQNRVEVVRVRTLLEQYVSADVANLLMKEEHDLHEIGDIRNVTVVFADLRNFTSLVQSLELEKLRAFLDDFFTLTADVVQRSGGTLNKFLGDGVLIIFGAPRHHPDPAAGAVETAKEIRCRFQEMREDYCRENRLFNEISLGIGVGRGEAFIGNVGSSKRFDYTVVGAAVNLAQRLASYATGDTILITDAVTKASGLKVRSVSAGNIRLKGFTELITIHEVIDS